MKRSTHLNLLPIQRKSKDDTNKPRQNLFTVLNDLERRQERDHHVTNFSDYNSVFGSINATPGLRKEENTNLRASFSNYKKR